MNDQTDGVAMGSPLAPILANIFMGSHERNWITKYKDTKPFFYCRYLDDIFCVFTSETEAMNFFSYVNKQHADIIHDRHNADLQISSNASALTLTSE